MNNDGIFSLQDVAQGKIVIASDRGVIDLFDKLMLQPQNFFGLLMQQSPQALIAFSTFFIQNKVSQVIELGTGMGGLTILLGICAQLKHFTLHTFDNNLNSVSPPIAKILESLPIDRQIGDVHIELTDTVQDLIKLPGPSVLLCDNGDKVREFNMFSVYLKSGDWIFAHDFHESRTIFTANEQNLFWPNLEISLENIQKIIDSQHLKKGLLYDSFLLGNWACFQKE